MAGSIERDPAPVEVALRPLAAADEWITAALETDPEVMRHLGGPLAPNTIPALHARRVRGVESGRDWFFVVHAGGPGGPPAGTICVWAEDTHVADGGSEIGWGLLPAFQGQGIAYLISDPLGDGSNIFGTAGRQIDYTLIGANGTWYWQVAFVIAGHVAALMLAHDRALALYEDNRKAVRSQYWMLGVMVGFTSLALWLLSSANS